MSFPNMFCAIILCFQHEQLEVRRLRSDVYINTDFINTKAESAKYIDGNREEKKKKKRKRDYADYLRCHSNRFEQRSLYVPHLVG